MSDLNKIIGAPAKSGKGGPNKFWIMLLITIAVLLAKQMVLATANTFQGNYCDYVNDDEKAIYHYDTDETNRCFWFND